MLWEDNNTFTSNPSTRVPAWLAVDTGTGQSNSGIENIWTYQNVITVTNPYMSRDTVTRESRNKIQRGKKNKDNNNKCNCWKITNQQENDYYKNKQCDKQSENNFTEDVTYKKLSIVKTSNKNNDIKTFISDSRSTLHKLNSKENVMKLKYARTRVALGDSSTLTVITHGNWRRY